MSSELTPDQLALAEKMIGPELRGQARFDTKTRCEGTRSADRYLYDFDLCPHQEG